MTTTDLKPGDIVQHPEHGYGVVLKNFPGVPTIYFAGEHGYENTTRRFTGWERVETCTRSERQWLDYRGGVQCTCDHCPETTNGPEEDCAIHGRPYEEWVKRAIDAKEELARIEAVRPGHVQVRVNDLDLSRWEGVFEGGWNHSTRVAIRAANAISAQRDESTQPDEPTLFGARIVVTDDLSGKAERWCRQQDGDWASENGALSTWAYLFQRGTVTLGWGPE